VDLYAVPADPSARQRRAEVGQVPAVAPEVGHLCGFEQCDAGSVDQPGTQPADDRELRKVPPAQRLGPQAGAHQKADDHLARDGVDRSTVDRDQLVRGDRQAGQHGIERAEQQEALGGAGPGQRAVTDAVLGDDPEL